MKDNKYFEELLKKHCPRYENNRCDRLFVCDFDCQVGKFLKNLFNENVILPINEWVDLNKNHAIELNKRTDDEYQVGYKKGSNEMAEKIYKFVDNSLRYDEENLISNLANYLKQFYVEVKE